MLKLLRRKYFWITLRRTLLEKSGNKSSTGIRVNLITTTRCPLDCSYCPMYMYGEVKKYEESTFAEWKTFIERFPHWIRLFYISGGEPSLYKDIVPLVNWLVEREHHVMIFTNLWKVENFFGIKNHKRLLFYPTFHKTADKQERYEEAYHKLSKRYQVMSKEFHSTKLKYSNLVTFFDDNYFKNIDDTIHLTPDCPKSLKMFIGCVELYRK